MARRHEASPGLGMQEPGHDAVYDPRPEHLFSLGLALEEIPAPQEPCGYCGSERQREFLDFDASTDAVIQRAVTTPGYGCTDCDEVFFPPLTPTVLRRAACEARSLHDRKGAKQLESEARLLEESIAGVATGA